jgi:peptide/nickel transport system permease protein
MFPTAFVVSVVTFFGLNMIPGDIALVYLDIDASTAFGEAAGAGADSVEGEGDGSLQAYIEAFKEKFDLNRPIHERYLSWLGGMLTGNPGKSMLTERPIGPELMRRLPVTLHIMFFALTFGAFFGISFGVLAAVLQDTALDYFVRIFAVFADSFPNFFLLTLLLLLPAMWFGYAPPTGYEGPIWEHPIRGIRQYIPPALILSLGSIYTVRITRSAMLEVLRSDFIRTARAKGLQERTVVIRHAVRNSLIPVVTIFGAAFASLLGGSVILENVMSLNGLGAYAFRAVQIRDFNVVQATVMYAAFSVMLVNLLVDLSYAYLDPRIRYR